MSSNWDVPTIKNRRGPGFAPPSVRDQNRVALAVVAVLGFILLAGAWLAAHPVMPAAPRSPLAACAQHDCSGGTQPTTPTGLASGSGGCTTTCAPAPVSTGVVR